MQWKFTFISESWYFYKANELKNFFFNLWSTVLQESDMNSNKIFVLEKDILVHVRGKLFSGNCVLRVQQKGHVIKNMQDPGYGMAYTLHALALWYICRPTHHVILWTWHVYMVYHYTQVLCSTFRNFKRTALAFWGTLLLHQEVHVCVWLRSYPLFRLGTEAKGWQGFFWQDPKFHHWKPIKPCVFSAFQWNFFW